MYLPMCCPNHHSCSSAGSLARFYKCHPSCLGIRPRLQYFYNRVIGYLSHHPTVYCKVMRSTRQFPVFKVASRRCSWGPWAVSNTRGPKPEMGSHDDLKTCYNLLDEDEKYCVDIISQIFTTSGGIQRPLSYVQIRFVIFTEKPPSLYVVCIPLLG